MSTETLIIGSRPYAYPTGAIDRAGIAVDVERMIPDCTGHGITAAADQVVIVGTIRGEGHPDRDSPCDRMPTVFRQDTAEQDRPAAILAVVEWRRGWMHGQWSAYLIPAMWDQDAHRWHTHTEHVAAGGNSVRLPRELRTLAYAMAGRHVPERISVHDRIEN